MYIWGSYRTDSFIKISARDAAIDAQDRMIVWSGLSNRAIFSSLAKLDWIFGLELILTKVAR